MYKYLNLFESRFDTDTLHNVIDFYNMLQPEDEAVIYFYSSGGEIQVMYALRDILDREAHRTTLYATNTLFSAAMWLFFTVECRTFLHYSTVGMFHLSSSEIRLDNRNNVVYDLDKVYTKSVSKIYLQEQKDLMTSLNFKKEEIKKIMDGEDVLFAPKRMKEFYNTRQKQLK